MNPTVSVFLDGLVMGFLLCVIIVAWWAKEEGR